MEGLQINGRFRVTFESIYEDTYRTLKKLIAPLLNLVRVDIKYWANSIIVFSPLIAATATFVLNAGLWFRRGRLVMVISSLAASCCRCAENPLKTVVQFSAATSDIHAGDWRKAEDHLDGLVEILLKLKVTAGLIGGGRRSAAANVGQASPDKARLPNEGEKGRGNTDPLCPC